MNTLLYLTTIGTVHSPLTDRATAPRQGNEGAPSASIEVKAEYADGLRGLAVGHQVLVLTWFHLADRDALTVHPRRDADAAPTGVFNTRSPDRPNPIGVHRLTISAIQGHTLVVEPLEALDGTPVVDIKPVLPRET